MPASVPWTHYFDWIRKSSVRALNSEVGRSTANWLRTHAPIVRIAIQPIMHAVHARLRKFYTVTRVDIEAAGQKPRLLVDVSTTFHIKHVSGIQRTVRQLVSALEVNSSKYEFEIVPVRLKRAGTVLTLVSAPDFPSVAAEGLPIAIRPRDSVFMLDSSWDIYPKWAECIFPLIRSNGGQVITCVYDILPVTHPHFFTRTTVSMFAPWFQHALRESDLLLSISKATRDEVNRWATTDRTHARSDFFHLGADSGFGLVPAQIPNKSTLTFLMVGTIEPRKGHSTVIEAFQRLWKSGLPVKLIFVGRQGWKTRSLMRKLRRVAARETRFRLHTDASDELLSECYQDADVVIAASLAEGFGLPLVETLLLGKPIIASDIAAFREVAADLPTYFEPGNSIALATAISQTLVSRKNDEKRTMPVWLTWSESADKLMAKIHSHSV